MKRIVDLSTYIFENLLNEATFSKKEYDWSYHNKMYRQRVISDILSGKDILLGSNGEDGTFKANAEQLLTLKKEFSNPEVVEYSIFNNVMKSIGGPGWSSIYKGDYSRQDSKSGADTYIGRQDTRLTPSGLGICSDAGWDNLDELTNHIVSKLGTNLPDSQPEKKQAVIQLCKTFMEAVKNISLSISIEDLIAGKFNKNITAEYDIDSSVLDSIDESSKNSIMSTFGEVLSGMLISTYTNSKLTFPDSLNFPVADFFVGEGESLCGVSVKSGNSGHRLEFGTVTALKIVNQLNKENGFEELFRMLNIEDAELKSKTETFVNKFIPLFLDESKTKNDSYANVLWKICFAVLQDNPGFKEIIKIIGVKNLSQVLVTKRGDKASINTIVSNFEKYSNGDPDKLIRSLIDTYITDAKSDRLSGWEIGTDDTTIYRNYSKIAHFLQKLVCRELNEKWIDTAELIYRYAIGGKQIYVKLREAKGSLVFEMISLKEVHYKFSCAGATWNEAFKYGSIAMNPVH